MVYSQIRAFGQFPYLSASPDHRSSATTIIIKKERGSINVVSTHLRKYMQDETRNLTSTSTTYAFVVWWLKMKHTIAISKLDCVKTYLSEENFKLMRHTRSWLTDNNLALNQIK